jgi:hypothetical protein
MSLFLVSGPYDVPLVIKDKLKRRINPPEVKQFWDKHPDICSKVGCYIFAFRAGRGIKPVYVGKATKSFKQEVFTRDKLDKYNQGLFDQKKGTPILYFVSLEKSKGPTNKKAIEEVETYLIQSALDTNPKILNDKKTSVEKWGIKGILRGGKGKANEPSKSLRECLSI